MFSPLEPMAVSISDKPQNPIPANPIRSIAQVDGSGTAAAIGPTFAVSGLTAGVLLQIRTRKGRHRVLELPTVLPLGRDDTTMKALIVSIAVVALIAAS